MIRSIEILAADHRRVLPRLNRLERCLDNLDGAATLNVIIDVAEFIGDEVKMHFLNEERFLFPLLEAVPGMKEGPLKMMHLEHEEFRKNNERFQELSQRIRFREDISQFRTDLTDTGRALIILLREHINKEDNVIFPMAERVLGERVMLEAAEKMRLSGSDAA